MKTLIDYDPHTGIAEYVETDHFLDKTVVQTVQDCEPILDHCKELAHSGRTDRGIKDGLWHYCEVPFTVMIEMRNKGINMLRPTNEDWKRFFSEIEHNYPYLKTTQKKMM